MTNSHYQHTWKIEHFAWQNLRQYLAFLWEHYPQALFETPFDGFGCSDRLAKLCRVPTQLL
jgi:hypothetical protein